MRRMTSCTSLEVKHTSFFHPRISNQGQCSLEDCKWHLLKRSSPARAHHSPFVWGTFRHICQTSEKQYVCSKGGLDHCLFVRCSKDLKATTGDTEATKFPLHNPRRLHASGPNVHYAPAVCALSLLSFQRLNSSALKDLDAEWTVIVHYRKIPLLLHPHSLSLKRASTILHCLNSDPDLNPELSRFSLTMPWSSQHIVTLSYVKNIS